jgi:hypothetical protein
MNAIAWHKFFGAVAIKDELSRQANIYELKLLSHASSFFLQAGQYQFAVGFSECTMIDGQLKICKLPGTDCI